MTIEKLNISDLKEVKKIINNFYHTKNKLTVLKLQYQQKEREFLEELANWLQKLEKKKLKHVIEINSRAQLEIFIESADEPIISFALKDIIKNEYETNISIPFSKLHKIYSFFKMLLEEGDDDA